MTTVEFDAKGKVLGRLATQVAIALRGKNTASYRPDRMPDIEVVVHNADKVVVTGRKEKQKKYYHFSGYPGGLKTEALDHLRARRPDQVLYQAVSRMLPKNRLRAQFLKKLKLEISNKV
jgi:large subunit ribosomal protein L13